MIDAADIQGMLEIQGMLDCVTVLGTLIKTLGERNQFCHVLAVSKIYFSYYVVTTMNKL